MTDIEAPADVGAPAETPAPSEAPVQTDAQTATAEINGLGRAADFQDAWSGKLGRKEQIAARDRKSELMRRAHGGPAADNSPALPPAIKAALDDPSPSANAIAEGMKPGAAEAEYHFNFQGADKMEVEALQQLDGILSEAALDIGASPSYAKATVEHLDQVLANYSGEPAIEADLRSQMAKQYGANLPEIQALANETIDKMTVDAWDIFDDALNRLPAAPAVWLIGRLATIARMNK